MRLRQAVLVAGELEPVAGALRAGLGLKQPFRDPGVAQFGLTNAVFALGDCFLEVVSPARADTAAGRYLARHCGDGGYMVIFDLRDLAAAKARAEELGIRAVWQIDLPDISANHLHPADIGGAIVSLDQSRPYGTWRWGGPAWTGKIGRGAPGRLAGITLAVSEPAAVAERWAHVLDVPLSSVEQSRIDLEDAEVRFVRADSELAEGLVGITLELPAKLRRGRAAIELGGVQLQLQDAD